MELQGAEALKIFQKEEPYHVLPEGYRGGPKESLQLQDTLCVRLITNEATGNGDLCKMTRANERRPDSAHI